VLDVEYIHMVMDEEQSLCLGIRSRNAEFDQRRKIYSSAKRLSASTYVLLYELARRTNFWQNFQISKL